MHLCKTRWRALQIWCRRINARSWHLLRVNSALDLQVTVRLHAPRRTHCGHASRQVEPRRCVGDLGNEQPRLANLSVDNLHSEGVGVVQMIVHPNQTRDHSVAGAFHLLRTRRNLGGRGWADGLYLAICDHDRLVVLRRCTRSIDDSDVVENEEWRIDSYEFRDIRCLLSLRHCGRCK